MNERIKLLAEQAGSTHKQNLGVYQFYTDELEKFALLIVRDVMNEVFVVYPGGKKGSDVEFQNITPRQWINQVYGVEE